MLGARSHAASRARTHVARVRARRRWRRRSLYTVALRFKSELDLAHSKLVAYVD